MDDVKESLQTPEPEEGQGPIRKNTRGRGILRILLCTGLLLGLMIAFGIMGLLLDDALRLNQTDLMIDVFGNVGIGVSAWTVNDTDTAKRLLSHGVYNITTRTPGALLALLSAASRGNVGFGDAVMIMAVGAWCGVLTAVVTLMAALGIQTMVSLVYSISGGRKKELPFVPAILGGYIVSLLII